MKICNLKIPVKENANVVTLAIAAKKMLLENAFVIHVNVARIVQETKTINNSGIELKPQCIHLYKQFQIIYFVTL
uniref:Uncharacterized protein n=1 Tax=Panagrolaimus sp. ES5 TaxID=591445 RepID=A0AC34G632_9BILA